MNKTVRTGKRKREENSSDETALVLATPASERQVILASDAVLHICDKKQCQFKLRPDCGAHVYECLSSHRLHACGDDCGALELTPHGRMCRVTGLIPSILKNGIAPNTMIVRRDVIQDHVARLSQLETQVHSQHRDELHPRLQDEFDLTASWKKVDELKHMEDASELATERAALIRETELLRRRVDPTDHHRCQPSTCTFTHHPKLGDVWVCDRFGRIHDCGGKCQHILHTPEGQMCAITGEIVTRISATLDFKEQENHGRRRIVSKTPAQITWEKQQRALGSATNFKRSKTAPASLTLALAQTQPQMPLCVSSSWERYLSTTKRVIFDILYSEKRRNLDQTKMYAAIDDAMKARSRYIRLRLNSGLNVVTPIVNMLVMNELRSRGAHIRIKLQPDLKRVDYYAYRCLEFWSRIRDLPEIINQFKDYVVGYLFTQREGYIHNGLTIVEKDAYLHYATLPDKSSLYIFDIHEGRFVNNRKLICSCIQNALATKSIDQVRLSRSPQDIQEEEERLRKYLTA